ncbi:tetraacyldisaccharide 4'-kinase [Winogradskyella marincola]|uniref:Tetraacyldisaccharide 4'-kinase n=1 Tax=Winogradskyella marincola TaxID=3037795 RepID=A0ABT6FY40_9FLAO|nr:tetraacyldisaccharide 4'-kinase [Winogradskyella sp. YYF002]MDG4714714.1 tetraacyldisaccharide 4'-kinase [Winogradskyella sp. YYF002]
MKFLRIILFPVVPIYYMVTWLRNWLYDQGIKSSKSYDIPVICVGNLSTGGTGKTPMIEYLIRLLKDEKSIATLSRGYKRITEGYELADQGATADTIGDEPFQFFRKFKDIKVAVDGNRQNGISQLLQLEHKPEVILLDDAYQHRKVKAGFNILLTAYYNLYSNDIVLPTGNLREPRSGAKRADIIVVTKCPEAISESEKAKISKDLKVKPHQQLVFSSIRYAEKVVSTHSEMALQSLPEFTLVTGIANAKPLVDFLKNKGLKFEHIEYPDHYSFRINDIEELAKKELIITTEKDFVRLVDNDSLEAKLFYLPIEIAIDKKHVFDSAVKSFVG